MSKKKIYIAGLVTCASSSGAAFKYFDTMEAAFSGQFSVLNPMTAQRFLLTMDKLPAHGLSNPLVTDHAIFQRDSWMVSQCDIMYLDLSGAKEKSIGCCMELAIASWLNKHTVVVMEKDNIHQHAFVYDAADVIFESSKEAIDYIRQLA